MAKIELKQIIRDCGHNDNIIKNGLPKRGLIRDFEVRIDGEFRVLLTRICNGKGYEVRDPDHRPIKEKDEWRNCSEIASQGAFMHAIERLLNTDRIPTLDDIAMDRIRDAAVKDNKRFDAHLANIDFAKKKYADELYRIVKLVNAAGGPVLEQSLVDLASGALILIDTQIALYDKNNEEIR